MCNECITGSEGSVIEDDCIYNCPNSDTGLIEIMDHYSITLSDMKEEIGF